MRSLIIITLCTLIYFVNQSCKNQDSKIIQEIDSISIFKDIRLTTDSVRIKLNQGDSTILQTNKGPLKIILIHAFKFCPLLGCGTCDPSAEIKVKFVLNGITYTPNPKNIFETIDCLKKDLPINTRTNCAEIFNRNYWLPTESLLFRVRYFTPYPVTTEEILETFKNKLYKIDLNIQNSCIN